MNLTNEQKYYSDDDAYTLMRAREIEADKRRFADAKGKMNNIIDNKEKELNALKGIVTTKTKTEAGFRRGTGK